MRRDGRRNNKAHCLEASLEGQADKQADTRDRQLESQKLMYVWCNMGCSLVINGVACTTLQGEPIRSDGTNVVQVESVGVLNVYRERPAAQNWRQCIF